MNKLDEAIAKVEKALADIKIEQQAQKEKDSKLDCRAWITNHNGILMTSEVVFKPGECISMPVICSGTATRLHLDLPIGVTEEYPIILSSSYLSQHGDMVDFNNILGDLFSYGK